MTVGGGKTPATTLWWDGFTISKNISDEDAEASFIAMMQGVSTDMVMANNDKAVWLIEGYKPGAAAAGVAASAAGGAISYPMLPFMGILHSVIGTEITEFLQGTESAEQALADVEAAYTAASRCKCAGEEFSLCSSRDSHQIRPALSTDLQLAEIRRPTVASAFWRMITNGRLSRFSSISNIR